MTDPFGGGFGGFDPRMFEQVPLFRELQRMMSWTGGPVNYETAAQTADGVARQSSAAAVSDRDRAELQQAVETAELWLDQVTELPRVAGPVRTYTPSEWAAKAATKEGLGVYIEPVADGMGSALSSHLPPEIASMVGDLGEGDANPFSQAMTAMGAMLYGMQTGTIAGHLAGQLLGTYGLGLPTGDPRVVGTVGDTAERFAADYGVEPVELRYWLAMSEAAHRRMYAGVPWLRATVAELVGRFAQEADFDASGMFEQLSGAGMDPDDPASIQRALESPGAFTLEPTSAQQATLAQLQALISFTEAWVDTVVRQAAGDKLTALDRIDEALRRRRAEQGPGERFLAQLVGLDLTPKAVAEAQAFCTAVITARGQQGLDRVWDDLANLPGPGELSDPSRWLVRMAAAEVEAGVAEDPEAEAAEREELSFDDAELDALLGRGGDEADPDEGDAGDPGSGSVG